MIKENPSSVKTTVGTKVSKYLLYAIGEIVLVMIGILLALQVNNWNENRKKIKQEQTVISNISIEFKQNNIVLKNHLAQYQEALKSTNLLMSLIGLPENELKAYNLDSILSIVIDIYDYSPSDNVMTEILASGKLNLISSDSLKYSLFEWSAANKDKEEAWETLDQFTQNMFLPYLTKNASLKNIDSYGFLKWKEMSRLESDNSKLFQDLEFENNLDNHAWSVTFYQKTLESLAITSQKIIQLTEEIK